MVQVRLPGAPGGEAGGWPGLLCEPVGPLALGWVPSTAPRPSAQPQRRMSGGTVVFV